MSLLSHWRHRLRGLSLIEVIIAMTILTFGCLVVFRMFHLGIYYSGTIGDEAMASVIAQKKLDEIRGWAYEKQSNAYNFVKGDWSIWDNKTVTDSEYSKFQINTFVEDYALKSPSSNVQPYHQMSHSAKIVKVVVLWTSGALPRDFTVVTVIGEPARESSGSLMVMAAILELGPGDSHTFTTPELVDENNDHIEDLSFRWYIGISTANGTLASSDDKATLINSLKLPDGSTISMDGYCSVYCMARCAGKIIKQNVQTVQMHKI
ncbi:MAG: prepilin-type N-terminal cleavage/methylation domain-containing protein [Candidatus Xenobiia bacterium LiM19]